MSLTLLLAGTLSDSSEPGIAVSTGVNYGAFLALAVAACGAHGGRYARLLAAA